MATPEQDWDAAFYEVWKGRLIPKLRAASPQRTGHLEHAIYPIFHNGAFRVFIRKRGFYWYFQPGLIEKWVRILNAELPAMIAYANDKSGLAPTIKVVPGLIVTEQ